MNYICNNSSVSGFLIVIGKVIVADVTVILFLLGFYNGTWFLYLDFNFVDYITMYLKIVNYWSFYDKIIFCLIDIYRFVLNFIVYSFVVHKVIDFQENNTDVCYSSFPSFEVVSMDRSYIWSMNGEVEWV